MSTKTEPVKLEEVERLIAQLSPSMQLRLAARICERLSNGEPAPREKDATIPDRLTDMEAWLAACDAFVESQPDRTTDVTEEIRQIREERLNRL